MKFSFSAAAALVGALCAVGSSAIKPRDTRAVAPQPYPKTRTLVSLHPASVPVLDDPDYKLWKISGSDPATHKFSANGLDFTIKPTKAGDSFNGGANSPVYTKPFPSVGQRLIGSGLSTKSEGGSITLTIRGLPAGEHSLSAWNNGWTLTDRIPSVAIKLNGVSQISGRPQSIQEANIYDSAESHFRFDSNGGVLTVVYTPRDGQIYLNGFEIDSESIGRQIRFPQPTHRKTGVKAVNGAVTASWKPTFNVDGGEYIVYLGTSASTLKQVATDLDALAYKFTGLSSGATYFWRVDVIDTWDGFVHLGRTQQFTVA